MNEIEIATSKFNSWKASLKDQEARFFKFEDEQRTKTRHELLEHVNQLNSIVQFDSMISGPVCLAPNIISKMDKVYESLYELQNCDESIWIFMDDEIMEADILLDTWQRIAMKSISSARRHMAEEHPSIEIPRGAQRNKKLQNEICTAKWRAHELSLSGTNPLEMEQFWESFDEKIGQNLNISSNLKFELLKACCIQDAAQFADSDIWRKDLPVDDFTQLSEALKSNFSPKFALHSANQHSLEAPAPTELATAFHTTPAFSVQACEIIEEQEKAKAIDHPLIIQDAKGSTVAQKHIKKEETFSTTKKEAAVQQETAASKAQDKAQDGKAISRPIVNIGRPFAPCALVTKQELLSWIKIGRYLAPSAPVTKQELLSWIKNPKSLPFAMETWRRSSRHAPVPVRIQELLSWIPKSEKNP